MIFIFQRSFRLPFGAEPHDIALIAEVNKKAVGTVWVRIMNDYGHIDNETPSFAISLYKEYRGLGIGTEMMKTMLASLKDRGYRRASLAVQKANYAVEINSSICISYLTKSRGGTFYTVNYARSKGLAVLNIAE